MKRRIAAYLMLSVALAATVFCYTLLQGMAGTQITGASSQRRYFMRISLIVTARFA